MSRAIEIAIVAAAAALAGCGTARGDSEGPSGNRNYQVGAFDRIEVAGPYEVTVATGSAPSVRATGGEQALEQLVVEVEGGTLKIHRKSRSGLRMGFSEDQPVQLAVTVPMLRGAEIAGSGRLDVDNIRGESFEAEVAGSGDLRLGAIDVRKLKMGIAGSGEIQARSGRAAVAQYAIAGSGDIDASRLVAGVASVEIAGSGNVNANATGTASVEIAGSGDVNLSGGAKCTVSKAGSGDVRCS
jgi:hypothetical protein